MMMLCDVRDFLLSLDVSLSGKIFAGQIDGNVEQCIGVYSDEAVSPARICIGGVDQTRMQVKRVKVLIHWTTSPVQAEERAAALWSQLLTASGIAGSCRILSVDPGAAPISAGKDASGICEYIIRAKITYERVD